MLNLVCDVGLEPSVILVEKNEYFSWSHIQHNVIVSDMPKFWKILICEF